MRVVGRGPPCILLEGGPWPTLHPQHCIQVIFQSEGNASGGPGLTLQEAGGRALAHPASATLHLQDISE
jgi:hypothetical protein